MKINIEKKYIQIGMITFMVIIGSILFYYFLFHFEKVTGLFKALLRILMPFVDGLVMAYLFSPIINYFETKIIKVSRFKEKGQKRIRGLLCISVIIAFLLLLYGFIYSIIPELSTNIKNIQENYTTYEKNVTEFFEKTVEKYPELNDLYKQNISEITKKVDEFVTETLLPRVSDGVVSLTSGIIGAVKAVINFFIGLIIAFYAMYNKEKFSGQWKKLTYAIMKRSTANGFIHNMRFTSKTFQNFIVGKLCDSIIIGLICFIVMQIIGLPYTLLISVIIGITNMIPLFGPFIGAIPSTILLFMVSPKQALYFIIMIIVLQQFDGNILGPKILGSSTGLSGFWVIFAITIFGGWLGVVGWLVGVPLFAVIYSGIKSYVNARLKEKNLSTKTEKYITVNYIDDDHHFIKIPKEEVKELASLRESSILSFISSKFKKEDDEVNNADIADANPDDKSKEEQ